MNKKVLIVGGVAGGASTAARLRRLDEEVEIIMFEKGEYISFANCGLPYYIGETIEQRENLLVQTPEAMKKRFNIDVRVNSEIISVNTTDKKVKVKTKEDKEYEESYDYLVVSPGAKPIKPPIEGIDSKRVFSLRNIPDTDVIKDFVDNKGAKSAVVIGGGYIGIEMAENLIHRGLEVVLVEAAPHILAPFDSDMVVIAEREMEDNGVDLVLGDGVKAFKEYENSIDVILNSGKKINADMVILSIGVKPDTEFLKDSGIEFGTKGHIIVNEKMKTSIEGVYAVGDAVEVVDYITKKKTAIALAGPANKQGRIVADNICGISSTYKGTQGSAIIKIFSLTGASTGANERTLSALNIAHRAVFIHPQSHASYYPGASPITLKIIFDDKGKLLGAQAFGYEGVDKRIDVIATAIRFNGTIYDLTELELCYAPPYSSAKDPVNMAGFVAENILSGKVDVFSQEQMKEFDKNKAILLDVRTDLEFESGYIEDAINIDVDNLRDRIHELDKNKEIWIYCQFGLRGYIASRILMQNGFTVKNLTGGYKSSIAALYKPKEFLEFKKNTQYSKDDKKESEDENMNINREIDACGLCCPGPLMRVNDSMKDLKDGEILKIKASDQGFYEDIKAWCKRTNNTLIKVDKEKSIITAIIKKGQDENAVDKNPKVINTKDNKTLVVFSGDLDKAIASFIIANGAAAMGKKVTMFFTFWGLNILRKHERVTVKKPFMDAMFGSMMPRGSKRLKLSNMNMMGMGAKMIRKVMKDKNVNSLEELIQSAIDNGIEIVACQMSMDVMGLTKEELIDGVKVGGVGYYLGEAEDSNVNLFI